jgi:L-ascorbate metabolism protein UlaG (beta-lactamase superfamily)
MIEKLFWLGHSSFRWEGSKTIYFDPWKLPKGSKKADIVCVSHEHFDHCSKKDIASVLSSAMIIVSSETAARQLSSLKSSCKDLRAMVPGDSLDADGVRIKAVESYNTNKDFHPKTAKKLGFIVTMDNVSIYHAGDTDFTPEMESFKCDVALLPVSGTYVMDVDEAVKAAITIKPRIAIPMHYGDIIGTASDAERFKDALKDRIEVKILRKED